MHDRCMELQQMRYAVAVAETRSFTRAAEQCHVVQSALSHQIKSLEKSLGVMLFARTSRRVELTPAGEAFIPVARDCLAAAARAAAVAAESTGEISGTVTIGLIPTVTGIDIPALLQRFHRAYPQVRVVVRSGSSDSLVESVRDRRIDVAVLGLPGTSRPQGVSVRELRRDRLMAVVGPGHRFADRRRLRLADLADETFADFPTDSPGRLQSDLAFTHAGLRRDVTFELMSPDLMLALVRRNLAVALLPPAFLPDDPGLARVPVTDGPERVEYLAWNDFNPTPAQQALQELLLSAP